jgi:pyruvate dehydrogenase E2 component (dihydrolipoamide acetyltransferase)
MSHEIHIPRLDWSMEEGTFVRWLKKPGENVSIGEPLFELESEKATQAIEAVDAGILYIPPGSPEPGAVVAVGTLLGYLIAAGEPIPAARSAPSTPAAPKESPRQASEIPAKPGKRTVPIASPRARRVARELGVDWTSLQGSGREGRIREVDVRAESTSPSREVRTLSSRTAATSSRRRTIAERLRQSRERTVPVTLTTSLDATNLVAFREKFKLENATVVPAYTDIVAFIVARVLTRHPHMAARREAEQASRARPTDEGIDIGIAVHTEDGLLVPVLRTVDRRPLPDIAAQSRTLIQLAREGRLTAAQMQGGVFTISSLGAYGIDAFTPVINYPELAILGTGAIRREATVLPDGRIGPRERMTISLTFDHAVLDGVPAAAFLRDVAVVLQCL